jgi:wobble nucleotide-excising tRNase
LGGDFLKQKIVKDLEFLSNGEQNFLSLAFELLKAKNSTCKLIVLDDPISSFDSIYKNKLAYAILSFLSSKKTLIPTQYRFN